MTDDAYYAAKRRADRVYFSDAFESGEEKARFAYQVFESGEITGLSNDGELVLGTRWAGRQQVKACFFVDDRSISQLVIQRFDTSGEIPKEAVNLSLRGEEIRRLIKFLRLIEVTKFEESGKLRLEADDVEEMVLSDDGAQAFARKNPKLIAELARNNIEEYDIVSIAYRKRQLACFKKMLEDPSYFEEEKNRRNKNGDEAIWQSFFEENQWIFGYSLFYVFTSSLDDGVLEHAVAGSSVAGSGKRVDGLLRTRGFVSSLCFVEIKTPQTDLLAANQYRSDSWSISKHVSGAIAQVHRSVERAEATIRTKLDVLNDDGSPTGEITYLHRPRCVLVIGNLNEFATDHGINERQFSSFELFRRQLVSPEIVTFDELYERARFIVEASDGAQTKEKEKMLRPSQPANTLPNPLEDNDIPF